MNHPYPEAVFIRHILQDRQTDFDRVQSLIKVPFETSGSTSSYGGDIIPRANQDWVIACRFSDRKWLPLFSNVSSADELFDANANNRRTEVAQLCHADGTFLIRINRARKAVLRFEWSETSGSADLFEAADLPDDFLAKTTKGSIAFSNLCKHYELPTKPRLLQLAQSGCIVVGANGKPIRNRISEMTIWSVRSRHGGNEEASFRLEQAIEEGDAQATQQALADGASLEWLPEASSSPLVSALFRAGSDGWRECAEAILEAGADIDKSDGDEPPIVAVCPHYVPEATAIEAASFLILNGADVNAKDSGGATCVWHAIVHGRNQLLELLLGAGADPTIPDDNGRSPLQWLQDSVQREIDLRGYSAKADLLTKLTGEKVAQPAEQLFTPELHAENERIRECLAAKALLAALPENIKYESGDPSDLRRVDGFDETEKQLLVLGFQKAGYATVSGLPLAGFSHEEHRIDAAVCAVPSAGFLSPLRIAVDMGLYLQDGSHRSVSNGIEPEGGSVFCHFVPAETKPAVLLDQLLAEVPTAKRQPTPPDGFIERHGQAMDLVLNAHRDRQEAILQPQEKPNGHVPRYEKLGCFPNVLSDKDPTWSTGTVCRNALSDLEEPQDSKFGLSMTVGDGATLLMLQHLEFAGRPNDLGFLSVMGNIGLTLFESLSRSKAGFKEDYLPDEFEFTLFALCFSNRWDDVARLCECLKASFATGGERYADDMPRSQAKFWLVVANRFREKQVRGSKSFPDAIRKDRHPLPKRLLKMWDAIANEDASAARGELDRSLVWKEEVPTNFREIQRFLAWPQSILLLMADHFGLKIEVNTEIPAAERLVTAKSLGGEQAG